MKLDDALLKLRALGYAEEAHAAAMELDAIRAALKPFAEFAKTKIHYAEMLGLPDNQIIWSGGDVEDPERNNVTIRISDCRAILKTLEGT